jgi:hypothetical protein
MSAAVKIFQRGPFKEWASLADTSNKRSVPGISNYEKDREMKASKTTQSGRMLDLVAAVNAIGGRQGYPPSFRQIAAELGIGLATVNALVWQCKERGLIEFDPGVVRSIRVADAGRRGKGR